MKNKMVPAKETKQDSAVRMYDARADRYEDSWHPDFSRRCIAEMPIKPGDRVLCLCCGTGLDAFLAAKAVGPEGKVVGVDISPGMLAIAQGKQSRDALLGPRLAFFQHDVTNLESLHQVQERTFDFIICSSAFVLFDDPAGVVGAWRRYLKTGGRVAIDVTHEHNLRTGLMLEVVAKKLGIDYPSNRAWIKGKDSFREILEGRGLEVEKVVEMQTFPGDRVTYLSLEEADKQFELVANSPLSITIMTPEVKESLRVPFQEEFRRSAVDGKVEVTNSVYLYIARNSSQ